jgi:hypothetical protein
MPRIYETLDGVAKAAGSSIVEYQHPRMPGKAYRGTTVGRAYLEIRTYQGIEGVRGQLVIEGDKGLFVAPPGRGWHPKDEPAPPDTGPDPTAEAVTAATPPPPGSAEEAAASIDSMDVAGQTEAHETASEGEFEALLAGDS